ncbi:Amino acid/polyamine transporter I, partial [Cynara cardunculus var. scolymus]
MGLTSPSRPTSPPRPPILTQDKLGLIRLPGVETWYGELVINVQRLYELSPAAEVLDCLHVNFCVWFNDTQQCSTAVAVLFSRRWRQDKLGLIRLPRVETWYGELVINVQVMMLVTQIQMKVKDYQLEHINYGEALQLVGDLCLVEVEATIGAGVYIFVGIVAKEQTGPAITISFLIVGIAAELSPLCFAELEEH